ncbi:DUF1648 domain-containing protein [Arthrobacter gengyunqii]|uniref:DUF1648 domain-containing protein n=1 Tax=Arthrobacter gengyunqii TaxID=2886940 RepID=A0A9X1S806_9MICC|nr:DUF1648 domain-containing protein [Arthrobacter gengyunqii]MCC3269504.1 DUF1648 domain-containing protein [Arthrobacter gengyunqii]UOY97657.1 DUF1648 domain-containing protein [Arthrobacter gengyunqii]
MEAETDVKIPRNRAGVWLIHAAAALILIPCFAYGAMIYESLPETIPTHWGAGGTPDAWADKSFGSVFAPLLIGAGTSVFLVLIAAAVPLMVPPSQDATAWELWRREGMIRGTVATMGGVSALTAALVGLLSVAGWRNPDALPMGPVLILLALILAVVFVAYTLSSRWARRSALKSGVMPTAQEQEEDKQWTVGGLYNNPDDPHILVPKRSGSGTGMTVNVGNAKGRAAVVVFLGLFVGVPLVFGVFAVV